jgi:hypothetical protein
VDDEPTRSPAEVRAIDNHRWFRCWLLATVLTLWMLLLLDVYLREELAHRFVATC